MALHLLKLCVFLLIPHITYATSKSSSQWTLEMQNHLKRLNKPPIKSIKSPDGDIIDCVHIYDQPALNHPFLKNHTIQMKPSVYPEGAIGYTDSKKESKSFTQLWQSNGRCPGGTIPIRRITKEDILRESSIKRFGRKKPNTIPRTAPAEFVQVESGHEYAIGYIKGDKYYGAKAITNVWNPKLQKPEEMSLAQIWLVAGPMENGKLNTVEAGWQVNPTIYGDSNTRIFVYWTSDDYQSTGCYNLKCPGFVQVNNEISVGAQISPVSEYGGGSQFELAVFIWKDPAQGNWWVQFGNYTPLGYWPASLFPFLADSATAIEWGGEIVNTQSDGQHTTTQMGSGHFPGEGFHKAAYFKNIKYVDNSNTLRDPQGFRTVANPFPSCYDIKANEGRVWEYFFYFGGPGRNPKCP